MEKSTWRIIRTEPACGAWNMALDEALMLSVGEKKQLPTLRLYAWTPPCLSLGYAQPSSDIDLDLLAMYRWEMVRRPSGGRAILHTDEITYAVIAPSDEPRMAGGILDSYRRLSLALIDALNRLGIESQADHEYKIPEGAEKNGPICFEIPSNYEITYGDKKLAGSAQVRRKGGVLQHGTLPLYGDFTRIIDILKYPDENARSRAKEKLLQRATNMEIILQKKIEWMHAADTYEAAFRETLNLDFIPAEPTQEEISLANTLLKEKYQNDDWTFRI